MMVASRESKTISRWRIYYGNGDTFSDKEGSPYDAPPANVQVVAVEDASLPRGFCLYHGKDAYYYNPEYSWIGCDTMGMWDYLMMYRGPKAVLFGRSLRDEDFWAIVHRATEEGLG